MNLADVGKKCTACGEHKPFSEFYKNKGGKFGLFAKCKPCFLKITKAWHDANKERVAANRAEWRRKNIVRVRASERALRQKNIEKCREKDRRETLFRTYGITLEQKQSMLAAQGGKCKACGSPQPGSKKGWHVDHCHDTGRIRGILCHPCNAAIGNAGESIERLRALIAYLAMPAAPGDRYVDTGNPAAAIA